MKHEIKLMRVYEFDKDVPGKRILVDRIWPRGVTKKSLEPFYWAKEICPSNEIRKYFGHKEERFDSFKKKYLKELDENPAKEDFLEKISDTLQDEDVIFLYGAKDKKINHVVILKEWVERNLDK